VFFLIEECTRNIYF